MLVILCDGSSHGNPGPSSCAIIVWDRTKGTNQRKVKPTYKDRRELGVMTNNEAEWSAVLVALQYAASTHTKEDIYIYSDSMIVVNQANKVWTPKHPAMKSCYAEFIKLSRKNFKNNQLKIQWVPRQLVHLADKHAR